MTHNDDWIDVTIGNVSVTGFVIKGGPALAVGEFVHVQHRGTALKGKVVRTSRTRLAVQSCDLIDLSSLFAKGSLKDAPVATAKPTKPDWWRWQTRD
jgi:hypothetical protein